MESIHNEEFRVNGRRGEVPTSDNRRMSFDGKFRSQLHKAMISYIKSTRLNTSGAVGDTIFVLSLEHLLSAHILGHDWTTGSSKRILYDVRMGTDCTSAKRWMEEESQSSSVLRKYSETRDCIDGGATFETEYTNYDEQKTP